MKKRAFEELNMAHFFNESLKMANVNLDPPPKSLHFSISPIIGGNVGLNYPLTCVKL